MLRLLMLLVWIFCTATVQAEVIRLHGSNTIGAALMPALVEAWLPEEGYRIIDRQVPQAQEVHYLARGANGDELRIEIASHGSSTAFRALADGRADVGMSSRRISANEIKQLADLGPLNQPGNELVLALDAVAVIVHPQNPLHHLSVQQLRDIFSGRIQQWRGINGLDGVIKLYARDDQSGTYEVFRQEALGREALAANTQRFESSAALVEAVRADPRAIGFVSLAYVKGVKALAIQEAEVAVEPSPFQVAVEDFPLARRLYLYLPKQTHQPLVEHLMAFVLGEQGQNIAAHAGYVSQNVFAAEVPAPAGAPKEYRDLIRGARRLSLNFRFDEQQFQLDAKAEHDLDRLAQYLREVQPAPREIMLLGFSDPYEAAPVASVSLASDRADYIASALYQREVVATRVRGYGSAAAVADNRDAEARLKNRRVEVWIR